MTNSLKNINWLSNLVIKQNQWCASHLISRFGSICHRRKNQFTCVNIRSISTHHFRMLLIRELYSIFIFTFYSFDIDLKFWTYKYVQLKETERKKKIKIKKKIKRITSEVKKTKKKRKIKEVKYNKRSISCIYVIVCECVCVVCERQCVKRNDKFKHV